MTTAEKDSLSKLEYQFQRLTKLIEEQSLFLERQSKEIVRLRAQNHELTEALNKEHESRKIANIAKGLGSSDPQAKEATLSYLREIIQDVKLSIKRLESE